MRRVVISQPMLFPWPGILDQVRLADVFVHYDDVQYSKGGVVNRVQIKTPRGVQWLTIPLRDLRLGTRIDEVLVSDEPWRSRHLATLEEAYAAAPHRDWMLETVRRVYAPPRQRLVEITTAAVEDLATAFGIGGPEKFLLSSTLGVSGSGWRRVLDVVLRLGGDVYVTGHGARHYLDHEAFEREGVRVEYVVYARRPYPQLHGEFTPFVSALDLAANVGPSGGALLVSETVPWREFLDRRLWEMPA
jgi:hypothetical protein